MDGVAQAITQNHLSLSCSGREKGEVPLGNSLIMVGMINLKNVIHIYITDDVQLGLRH